MTRNDKKDFTSAIVDAFDDNTIIKDYGIFKFGDVYITDNGKTITRPDWLYLNLGFLNRWRIRKAINRWKTKRLNEKIVELSDIPLQLR